MGAATTKDVSQIGSAEAVISDGTGSSISNGYLQGKMPK